MSWEITQPPPEHEALPSAGLLPGTGVEAVSRGATLGSPTSVEGAVPQLTLTTTVDAGELMLFRSDLQSTLEGVVVCAAGRALSAIPQMNVTVAERIGGPAIVPAASSLVQLLVLCDDGIRVGTVDAGVAHTLTEVRDAVATLVDELRGGRVSQPPGTAALSLSTFALSGAAPPRGVASPMSCALAVGRLVGGMTMQVGLSVDARVVDADQASRLLATIVRLLEHPYRRLR